MKPPYQREPLSARHSLRWRLPLLIAGLIAVVLLTFLLAAYRTVETTLVGAGGQRARLAAEQVASLLNTQRTLDELPRRTSAPDFRDFLQTGSGDARERALKRLTALATTGPRRVELWSATGVRLLEVSVPGAAARGEAPVVLPAAERPSTAGISALASSGGVVFSDIVGEIRDGGEGGEASLLGYLVIRTTFSVSPPGIIGRLVGRDAVVAVGNRAGGVWTDFSAVVPAPAVDLMRDGIAEYRAPNGDRYVGALVPIRGSPWAAWVGFPRQLLVEPAQTFLAQMTLVAILFLAGGAVLARLVTTRITRPLSELSGAAEAIAGGDFSRRVKVAQRNEIGQLAHAFNAMVGHVEEAQQRLEARVLERTGQLAAARHEAERANRAKSEFLSLMSHDLRTPLNAILGFGQLLELDKLNPKQSEYVQQILVGGRHLLDLISEVLDITRVESGQLSVSPEPVLVRDVVQRAVELVRPLAAQQDVSIVVEPFAPTDAVYADRQRLSQVLLNLLSNAVKYNRPRGRVTVSGGPSAPGRFRLAVTDTGAGISASKRKLLFRPFERLGAEQTAVEGTGLGLALSRALALAMGGDLGVDSVVDHGSTFWVDLAVAEPDTVLTTRDETIAEAVPPGRGTHPGTVLYIEDNRSNVRLMERILSQRPGLTLQHAPHGRAGLALLRERRPDLVLLDLHLPDMTGEEVLHQLWADPASRDIPIVIVTADATPGLQRRLISAGATACLTKPLNVKELLALVDAIFRKHPPAGGHT